MIENAIDHDLYCDLERMLKKRILNRTLDRDHALCLLVNMSYIRMQEVKKKRK